MNFVTYFEENLVIVLAVLLVSFFILFFFVWLWVPIIEKVKNIFLRKEKIFVIGSSMSASIFLQNCSNKAKNITFICLPTETLEYLPKKLKGINQISLKKLNLKTLKKAGVHKASSCLLLSDNDQQNLKLADMIFQLKEKNNNSILLNMQIRVENDYTRSLFVDQKNYKNKLISTYYFSLTEFIAKCVYDKFPPHRYVDNATHTNKECIIAIIGYTELTEDFLIENAILSQYDESNKLRIIVACKNANEIVQKFYLKFPGISPFVNITSIELFSETFSDALEDDQLTTLLPSIDVAYLFGDDDAKLLNTALSFKQLLYVKNAHLRSIPLVVCLQQDNNLLNIFDNANSEEDSMFHSYEKDLMIYSVRLLNEFLDYEHLIANDFNKDAALLVNFYYSIKYKFKNELDSISNKDHNDFLDSLEHKFLNFQFKKGNQLESIEEKMLDLIRSYTGHSAYRLKPIFGINNLWMDLSQRQKESNMFVVRHLDVKLSLFKKLGINELTKKEISKNASKLALVEHNRWSAEKIISHYAYGEIPKKDKRLKSILTKTLKINDNLKPFNALEDFDNNKDMDMFILMGFLKRLRQMY